MLRDAKGNRLFRKVKIRIFYPDNVIRPEKFIQHAEAKKGFSPENIDELLMQIADKLDEKFPWWEFKLNELAPEHRTACYTFTCTGLNLNYKPPAPEAPSVDPVPATPAV